MRVPRKAAATTAACKPGPQPDCTADQMQVLRVATDGSCRWTCENNPYYKKPAHNKGPIIGGSVGATAAVLLLLLVALLFVQIRKRRRERAAYLKDTADLASELSDLPLIAQKPYSRHPSSASSASSVPSTGITPPASQISGASRFAQAFGLWSAQRKGAHGLAPLVAKVPRPGEAGTELTMDIVYRPPESDPTLAVADGDALPYRREKTADAYPLLAQLSQQSSAEAVSEATGIYTTLAPQPSRRRKLSRKLPVQLVSPEDQLIRDYEVARSSADAAIAAARDSSVGTPLVSAFNPFNAVPSIRSLPYDEEMSPIVSRKHSDRSTKNIHTREH
ncbi:hypothetical protein GGI07_004202 [Coemansia sp. Benny D115]|nr:hypothetical protein GGI07_004202 [Coemansia sp. Benny D115]